MRGLISLPPRDVFWPWDVKSVDVHVTPTHKTEICPSIWHCNGGASHPRHIREPWAVLWRPAARGSHPEPLWTWLEWEIRVRWDLGIIFFYTVSSNTAIYLGRTMHTWVQLKKERDSRAIIFGEGHTGVPVVLTPTEPSSFTCLEMPCM